MKRQLRPRGIGPGESKDMPAEINIQKIEESRRQRAAGCQEENLVMEVGMAAVTKCAGVVCQRTWQSFERPYQTSVSLGTYSSMCAALHRLLVPEEHVPILPTSRHRLSLRGTLATPLAAC